MSNEEAEKFYESIDKLDYYFPSLLELLPKKAQYQREYYNQLVKRGFTKEEALEIVKAQPTPF